MQCVIQGAFELANARHGPEIVVEGPDHLLRYIETQPPMLAERELTPMATVQKIAPCLWFDRDAEDASKHYIAIFGDGRILNVSRYGDNMPLPKGTAMMVEFELAGQRFQGLNGGPVFKFTEAVSLSIRCENQDEVDHFWARLSEGGSEGRCGWLRDKFGLSWQVVPRQLAELMSSGGPGSGGRVMQALMKMNKLDIAALERAHQGN